EVLGGGKREAEERAKQLAADLGALRKTLADKEAQVESLRFSSEAAQEAAAQAAQQQQQAEQERQEALKAWAAAAEKHKTELTRVQSEFERREKVEVAALRREVESLREKLADKEQRLAVKPKMAELQYRLNELAAQLADVTSERDAAVAESNQTAQMLQDEQEAHFDTDGRRVRLGEEVERLRGILKMYHIPF
ncbi:hypothetical protein Agub_g2550, partial [Astrephomene gubernaculifera]